MIFSEELKTRIKNLLRQPRLTGEETDAANDIVWQLRYLDFANAADLSEKILRLVARGDYRRGHGLALRNFGWYQFLRGDHARAAQTLKESCQMLREAGDELGLASAQNNLAVTEIIAGDYAAARAHHRAALAVYRKNGAEDKQIASFSNLGIIHEHLGDYPAALECCYQSLAIAQKTDSNGDLMRVYNNLSDTLRRVGEISAARRYAQLAIEMSGANHDLFSEAVGFVNLGAAEAEARLYDSAAENLRHGLQLAAAFGNIETVAEAETHLANLLLAQNQPQQSLTLLDSALSSLRGAGARFYQGAAWLAVGKTYDRAGDSAQALEHLEQALEIGNRLDLRELLCQTHLALSQVFEKRGKTAAALFHYQSHHRLWQTIWGFDAMRSVQRLLLTHEPERHSAARSDAPAASFAAKNGLMSRTNGAILPGYQLRRIIEFVRQNLEKNLSVGKLAKIVNLNERYFIRLFKQTIGTTPYQFLLAQRIERAQLLLETTALPLVEIAGQCGFNSQAHLSAQFRAATGATPHKYRGPFQMGKKQIAATR